MKKRKHKVSTTILSVGKEAVIDNAWFYRLKNTGLGNILVENTTLAPGGTYEPPAGCTPDYVFSGTLNVQISAGGSAVLTTYSIENL